MRKKLGRHQEIESIIARLQSLEGQESYVSDRYAVRENIIFMNAIRSFPKYLFWLLFHAPSIDGERLKELTDFSIPEWDIAMHGRLTQMQKRKFPGLMEPLVSAITDHLLQRGRSKSLTIANFGSGAMETDRQVLSRLIALRHPHPIHLVSIDTSPTAHKLAQDNLKELEQFVETHEVEYVTHQILEEFKKAAQKQFVVIHCKNDILRLDHEFSSNFFDLVYHSLFKHHLSSENQERLDQVVDRVAKNWFEFDGYFSRLVIPAQTIVGWNYPVFLNSELFSNLRFMRKKKLQSVAHGRGIIQFYPLTGFYLLIKKPQEG